MRRGLGAVNVGPLALAQFSGRLSPAFLQPQYFQPSYLPAGQMSQIGAPYATDAFASQLAQLLGGQVVKAPPPGNLNGTGIPDADWISAGGQMIFPGDLMQPGTILSFPDECTAEHYFANSIPGAMLSDACAGGSPGLTPTQLAVSQGATIPSLPSGQSTIVGYTPPIPVSTPVTLPVVAPPAFFPTLPSGPSSLVAPPPSSQVVTQTPGSNVSAQTGAPAPASSDVTVGGFDLSSIPWYVWAGGAGLLLYAFGGQR